jgi:hypothetical protein
MHSRSLVSLSGLVLAGLVVAAEAPHDVLSKLRSDGEVTCQPSLPVFCANMHIACAGQTNIPTIPFKLRASRSAGAIQILAPDESLRALYERPTANWDSQGTYLLLQPSHGQGYIRVLANGNFAFRHYSGAMGLMSLGLCK